MTSDFPKPSPVRRAWSRIHDEAAARARRRGLSRATSPRADRPEVDILVSLTSHRARFTSLPVVVRSLLDQSVTPARILLWIPEADCPHLPEDLLELIGEHVEVLPLRYDYGPASKLIPALAAHPATPIATADDDVAYPRRWLESLATVAADHPSAIVCRRAHWITFDPSGVVRAYLDWDLETARCGPDHRLFFTGHGGVLYPPAALHPDVTHESARRELSTTNDDVWFNWMARLAGTPIVRVPGPSSRRDNLPGTQDSALLEINVAGGANDAALGKMSSHYGRLDPRTGGVIPVSQD